MEDEKQALSPVLAPIESDFDTCKFEKFRPSKCVRTWATPDSMFAFPHFDRFVSECVPEHSLRLSPSFSFHLFLSPVALLALFHTEKVSVSLSPWPRSQHGV